jgi:hypothetical protein
MHLVNGWTGTEPPDSASNRCCHKGPGAGAAAAAAAATAFVVATVTAGTAAAAAAAAYQYVSVPSKRGLSGVASSSPPFST